MKRRNSDATRRLRLESLESRRLLAGDLRVTELDYNPHPALLQFGERDVDPDEFEFIEVANVGDQPLNLDGYHFTQGVRFQFDRQFLNAGDRLVIARDKGVLRSRYGSDVRLAAGNDGQGGKDGQYGGNLANDGELIELRDNLGRVVQSFTYYDRGEWPRRPDGQGSSLELIASRGEGNDPKSWRASSEFGGSPGWAGQGFRRDIVINEMLTHTDPPQWDTIELFNRTAQPIDMTGWYISDSAANLFRFTISGPGSVIQPHSYQSFDENLMGFGFRGQESDNAFLVEPNSVGQPMRFVDAVTYGATQNGTTLGRWSNGEGELFLMEEMTFNDTNTGPQIGDVIISELQYHPASPAPGSLLSENDLEFIELYNRTGTPLDIGHWRLNDYPANTMALFDLPEGTTIPAYGTLLVLGFDPHANPAKTHEFRQVYLIAEEVPLLGPYSDAAYDPNPDQLDDDGETLLLERPEDILQLGRGYVLVDRVIYDDTAPWPEQADGTGYSLTRADLDGYGDFAATWRATLPTPDRPGLPGDVDLNGFVEVRRHRPDMCGRQSGQP